MSSFFLKTLSKLLPSAIFCKKNFQLHDWGNWVSAGNQIKGNKRFPIEKRVCNNCGQKEIQKQKYN